ncbi:MAG: hypothetical protein ACK55I_05660, partial [bacterium]
HLAARQLPDADARPILAAHAQAAAIGVERVAEVETLAAHSSLVVAEQHQHPRLVGLQGEEPWQGEQKHRQQRDAGHRPPRGCLGRSAVDDGGNAGEQQDDDNRQSHPAAGDLDFAFLTHGARGRRWQRGRRWHVRRSFLRGKTAPRRRY